VLARLWHEAERLVVAVGERADRDHDRRKLMRVRTIVGVAALAVGLLAATGGVAMAETDRAASVGGVQPDGSVPPAVQVPPGQKLIADLLGRGVQVYQCTGGAWVFVEPAANLVGWTTQPANVATAVHFRGPSWESTDDGSLVEARVVASSPVSGSIPQLLLQATKTRGDGVFGRVSYLQRLATSGGAAPAGACSDGATVGVRYQAEYRFFTPAG
jgi:hypothetical protein